MVNVKANWSGTFPCLCHGEWSLEVNGIDVSDKIPEDLRHSEMNTFGEYSAWHFEDWIDVWTSYESGLPLDEWLQANKAWLDTISMVSDVQVAIFHAINQEDWRHGSCGGCI